MTRGGIFSWKEWRVKVMRDTSSVRGRGWSITVWSDANNCREKCWTVAAGVTTRPLSSHIPHLLSLTGRSEKNLNNSFIRSEGLTLPTIYCWLQLFQLSLYCTVFSNGKGQSVSVCPSMSQYVIVTCHIKYPGGVTRVSNECHVRLSWAPEHTSPPSDLTSTSGSEKGRAV